MWSLKPERWGSPLVQEKYQEEMPVTGDIHIVYYYYYYYTIFVYFSIVQFNMDIHLSLCIMNLTIFSYTTSHFKYIYKEANVRTFNVTLVGPPKTNIFLNFLQCTKNVSFSWHDIFITNKAYSWWIYVAFTAWNISCIQYPTDMCCLIIIMQFVIMA